MKKKILVVCRANVTRSRMAIPIFRSKLGNRGLNNSCEISSAGVKCGMLPEHDYMDIALQNAGYSHTGVETPRQIKTVDGESADMIFTINTGVYSNLNERFEERPDIRGKLYILPHYGLPRDKRQDDIFDPRYILVSPEEWRSKSQPLTKRAAALFLNLAGSRPANFLVDTFTPYIPLTRHRQPSRRVTELYSRTVRELEYCIEGAIERMEREGFFNTLS